MDLRRRSLVSVALVSALLVGAFAGATPSGAAERTTRQRAISRLLHSPLSRWMSGPARMGLQTLAGRRPQRATGPSSTASGERRSPLLPGTDVQVNNPAGDGIGDPDMTSQSEASLGASGSNIVTAYNDDGRASPFFKASDNLTGYSWSSNGGSTWHDSAPPNPIPGINLGDPVVASDRWGNFYLANLELDFAKAFLGVTVATSSDGGQTFGTPKLVSTDTGFTSTGRGLKVIEADKPWLTVGPDPTNHANDIAYLSWTEFYSIFSGRSFRQGSRIMISRSVDGGQTWSPPKVAVDQPLFSRATRTVAQITGSSLAVGPAGRLYLGFERFVDTGRGTFATHDEWITRSMDGAMTFRAPVHIATARQVGTADTLACGTALNFGPGQYVRTQEFPSLGVGPNGDVFMAYDATGLKGTSQVRVSRSSDGGKTWAQQIVVRGSNAFMPALAADPTGVGVVYYAQVAPGMLQSRIASSPDGSTWTRSDLGSSAFPVPISLPPTDPLSAPCYMGDYNGAFRTGGTTYAAWGDARNTVTNAFWPGGRPDLDVFFNTA